MATKQVKEIRKKMEELLINSAVARESNIIRKESLKKIVQELVLARNKLLLMERTSEVDLFLNVITGSFELLKLSDQAMQITQGIADNFEEVVAKLILNQHNTYPNDSYQSKRFT